MNATGRAFLTHTVLPPRPGEERGRYVIRCAIGAPRTEGRHVDALVALLQAEAAPLTPPSAG